MSRDGGYSFAAASGAPLLQLVDFAADGGVVGLDPSGGVYGNKDLDDWQRRGSVDAGQVQALTAGATTTCGWRPQRDCSGAPTRERVQHRPGLVS